MSASAIQRKKMMLRSAFPGAYWPVLRWHIGGFLVFTDVDGIMTDALVMYSNVWRSRSFSVRDGHGIEMLRSADASVIMLSGEGDENITARAEKLGIPFIQTKDKLPTALKICNIMGISIEDTAFAGDDVMDIPLLERVGIAGAPKNSPALNKLKREDVILLPERHAFRAFADELLSSHLANRT